MIELPVAKQVNALQVVQLQRSPF